MVTKLRHTESNLEAESKMAHPQARLKAITHLQATHTQGEHSGAPASPTFEQLLREAEGSRWSAAARSSHILPKEHYREDDHIRVHTPPRKSTSVLAKVKEKAKKWRNNLSFKKKHSSDVNSSPSSGVSLEREDAEDGNPEYLGAPRYESEMAPEGYKEKARKQAGAISAIPEKHALGSNGLSRKNIRSTSPFPRSARAITKSMADNFPPSLPSLETQRRNSVRTPKSAPAIVSLSPIMQSSHPSMPSPHAETVTAPSLPRIATKQGELSPEEFCKVSPSSAPAKIETGYQRSTSKHIWDKGVSVKEYIMQKLEPGEDEKALSQVISQAISPRKDPDEDDSAVMKLKEAVTSLLSDQESSSRKSVYHSAQNSSTKFPISTHAYEVVEEDSHKRILQAN